MVTVRETTEATERRRLNQPPHVGGSVPGWRGAIPIYDPQGVAAQLKSEAGSFRWETISQKCDLWVAKQTVGWVEEAIKLVRALATGNQETAAVQRNLLAEGLGFVVAIHRRLFWDSENEFWERIGGRVGGKGWSAQKSGLGVPEARLEQSCWASLELYSLTARAVWDLLGADPAKIVSHVGRVAGVPSPSAMS